MEIDTHIAQQLRGLRTRAGWTLEHLAQASGVSRAMISRIERAEVSATAALLSRLSAALHVPLSELLSTPAVPRPVQRRAERPRWQDPATGLTREDVSPPLTGSAVEIMEVELPPHARVDCRLPRPAAYSQHVVMLTGGVRITQEEGATELRPGDALYMVPDGALQFENTGATPCRYLLVMERARGLR